MWLARNDFPEPFTTTLCKDPKEKLEKIFQDWIEPYTYRNIPRLLLVDDSHQQLVKVALELYDRNDMYAQAVEQLTIIGFGDHELAGSIYPHCGLRTISLPSWTNKDLAAFQTELVERTGFSF